MLCEFFVQDNFSNGSYMIVKVTTVVLFKSLLGSCVSDCTHWVDGHYQSCETCQGYVSCSNQILYKRRCPPNLVWDDHAKQCLYTSTTCPPLQTTPKTNSNFIFSESKWSFFQKKKIQKFIFSRCIISIKFTGINNGASAFHFLINALNFV